MVEPEALSLFKYFIQSVNQYIENRCEENKETEECDLEYEEGKEYSSDYKCYNDYRDYKCYKELSINNYKCYKDLSINNDKEVNINHKLVNNNYDISFNKINSNNVKEYMIVDYQKSISENEREYLCKYCNSRYVYKRCLINHIRKKHSISV